MPPATSKPLFRVNSNRRKPLGGAKRTPEVGQLLYGMLYDSKAERNPTVPQAVYSSLFQRILIHRWQISAYISKLRNYGMRPDYPAAHVLTMINTGPTNPGGNMVKVSRFGRPSQKGTMTAPKRFRKALPVQSVPYTPPEY